jgi:mannose-6-phosphate isomerase-like protein (cupin superfamily)
MTEAVDLSAVLEKVDDFWSPLTVTTVNDYDIRVVKIPAGEFSRHSHPETDELFLVLKGSILMRMEDGDVPLGTGQVYVVPRGIQHQPTSEEGAEILLFEPSTTTNTGDTPSKLTAERKLA